MAQCLWKDTSVAKVWVCKAGLNNLPHCDGDRPYHTGLYQVMIPVVQLSKVISMEKSCFHRPGHLKPCGGLPQLQERLSAIAKSWLISGDWWERLLSSLVLVAIHHTATVASEHLLWYFYRGRQIQSESPDHGQSGEMLAAWWRSRTLHVKYYM